MSGNSLFLEWFSLFMSGNLLFNVQNHSFLSGLQEFHSIGEWNFHSFTFREYVGDLHHPIVNYQDSVCFCEKSLYWYLWQIEVNSSRANVKKLQKRQKFPCFVPHILIDGTRSLLIGLLIRFSCYIAVTSWPKFYERNELNLYKRNVTLYWKTGESLDLYGGVRHY